MLCVGISRHGYGAWERIRDDPELELKDKFFLEEHRVDKRAERERLDAKNAKSPGAVHLVRRADYLISVLKSKYVDDPAAKRAVENHHRNNKKNQERAAMAAGSPAAGPHRKAHRDSEKARPRTSQSHRDSSERFGTPKSESRHAHGKHESEARDHRDRRHREDHGHTSHHNRHASDHRRPETVTNGSSLDVDPLMVMLFKPVRESLKKIKATTKSAIPDGQQRANELRVLLKQIGNFITEQVAELDDNHDSVEKRFW
jgi:chromodomain-helicase-DNA-binding protein 1